MLFTRPFGTVTATVDGDVLQVLASADQWFPLSRVHSLVDARSRSGLRKSIERLVDQGVVARQELGSQYAYRLNRDHLAAPAVIELANLYGTYLQRLRDTIGEWEVRPVLAALFGSAARGSMRYDSDIDLFLVRPDAAILDDRLRSCWDAAVSDIATRSTSWTGNDTRVLEMSEAEVAQGLAEGDQVLLDIRTDGVILTGSATTLGRVRHG